MNLIHSYDNQKFVNKTNIYLFKKVFLGGGIFIVYLITAIFSSGFHHYDEHYQILEFADFKLGLIDLKDVAWEYQARIRPSLQPAIALGVFKLLIACNIRDRFIWAFMLRLLTALLAIISINNFTKVISPSLPAFIVKYFLFFSFLLWFLPYVNVRFSSESWSGLFLLNSLTLTMSLKKNENFFRLCLLGLFMSLSIIFRYQTALSIAGILCWLIFVNKIPVKSLFILVLTIFTMLLSGLLLDRWFYGEWVLTIYNYFQANIVDDVASGYGVAPFYQYFIYILNAPIICFGIIIISALLIVLYKQSNHLLVWVILPFLVIHCIIPHKELRFLFPLANLTPAVVFIAISSIKFIEFAKFRYVIIILLFVNALALVCNSLKSAGDSRLAIADFIHTEYGGRMVNLIITPRTNPYDPIHPKDIFYKNYNVEICSFDPKSTLNLLKLKKNGYINLLTIYKKDAQNNAVRSLIRTSHLVIVRTSFPRFMDWGIQLYDTKLADKDLALYEFR